jgi:hypothetical protein
MRSGIGDTRERYFASAAAVGLNRTIESSLMACRGLTSLTVAFPSPPTACDLNLVGTLDLSAGAGATAPLAKGHSLP